MASSCGVYLFICLCIIGHSLVESSLINLKELFSNSECHRNELRDNEVTNVICDTIGSDFINHGGVCDVFGDDSKDDTVRFKCNNGVWQKIEPTLEKAKFKYQPRPHQAKHLEKRGLRVRVRIRVRFRRSRRRTVTVVKKPPTFSSNCPPGDLVSVYYTPAGETATTVTWTVPTATDPDGSISSLTQVIGISRGGSFSGTPSGQQHAIAYEAKDNDGQSAFCYFSFTVKVRTCDRLAWIQNGILDCPNDNILGSTCTYQCIEGYQLVGSSEVTCQNDGNPIWTAIPTCHKVSCGDPVTVANGEASCSDPGYVYNSFCSYTCDAGYDGHTLTICRADSSWNRIIDNTCTDDEPPTIICQTPQVFYADRGSTSTSVTWALPEVSDHVDPNPILTKTNGPEFGVSIEAGTSQYVIYQATDADGNVSPQCTIELRVLEISCGHPLNTLEDADLRFNCSLSTYNYGDTCHLGCALNLPLDGTELITCEEDTLNEGEGYWSWGNGTMPFCRDVACPDLNAPRNGALVYDNTNSRPTATMTCNNQFDIPDVGSNFNGLFLCQDSGAWNPTFPEMPDCSEAFTSRGFWLPAEIFYYSGSCGIDDNIDQQFESIVAQLNELYSTLCPSDTSCSVNNPRIVCGPIERRKRRDTHWRYRRDSNQDFQNDVPDLHLREKRTSDVLQFNFNIETNFNFTGLSLNQLYTKADEIQLVLLKDATQNLLDNGTLDIPSWTIGSDSFRTDEYGSVYCDPGYVLDGLKTCKACPRGYYENSGDCTVCPVGEYSDASASSTCTKCQDGYSTRIAGSVSAANCTKLCDPGYSSPDTFAPCAPCKIGFYQTQMGQTSCTPCSASKTTLATGRTSETDCQYFDIILNRTIAYSTIANISVLQNISAMLWTKVLGDGTPRASIKLGDALEVSIRDHILVTTDPSDVNAVESVAGSSSSSAWIHTAVTWDTTNNLLSVFYRGTPVVDQMSVTPTRTPLVEDGYMAVVADGDAAVMVSGFRVFDGVLNQADITTATQSCQLDDINDVLNMDNLKSANTVGINVGTPASCDAIDECLNNPCNGHKCTNEINSFTCTCSDGWSGNVCDIPPDHCIDNDCLNGATCINKDTDYECECLPGYSGFQCDIPPVDGGWASWSSWSDCPVGCSNTTRTRERACDSPPPDPYGQNCDGDDIQIELCNNEPCPECPELPRQFGHLVRCNTTIETGTMTCNFTCKDGYDLPDGLDFTLYRCGLDTDYKWEPRSTVPKCVGQGRPSRYVVTTSGSYGTTISSEHRQNVVTAIESNTNGADCFNANTCTRTVSLSDEGDNRRKRSTGTTVTVTFSIDINGTSDLKIEEFETNETVSEGLQEIFDALTNLEATAEAINSSASTVFDVTVNGVTYLIDSSTLTYDGSTICGATEVVTDGLCTECPEGTYKNDELCAYCEKGTYQNISGQTTCIQCPSGYTTVTIGSSSIEQCSVLDNTTSTSTSTSTTTSSLASTSSLTTETSSLSTSTTVTSNSTGLPATSDTTTTASTAQTPSTANTPSTTTFFEKGDDSDETDNTSLLIIIIASIGTILTITILVILIFVLVKKTCRPSKISDSHADLRENGHQRIVVNPFFGPSSSVKEPFRPKLRKEGQLTNTRKNTSISISDLEVAEIETPRPFYRHSNFPNVTNQKFDAPLYFE